MSLLALHGAMLASSSWAPTDLSGLRAWYDAHDAASITLRAGQYVTQWADKSGNNYHLSQATNANQPDYITSGPPLVRFTGSPKRMTAGLPLTSQPVTIAIVCSTGTAVGGVLLDGTDGANRVTIGTLTAATSEFALWAGGAIPPVSWGSLPAALGAYVAIYNGASSVARMNGAVVGTGNPGGNSLQGLTLGCRYSFERFLPADIHEIVICSGALSGDDLTNLEAYLMNKWGL